MFLVFVLYHLTPSGNSKGSEIRHGIFCGLIFGAEILLGFNFCPHPISRHLKSGVPPRPPTGLGKQSALWSA